MTRINVGVNPANLSDKHLLAEHREITRIPNAVSAGKLKGPVPAEFCLGTGHMTFFRDKLDYLARRYHYLYAECVKRGFKVTAKHTAFTGCTGGYIPTQAAFELVRARIIERGHDLQQQKVWVL